jgi:hypothetical protein
VNFVKEEGGATKMAGLKGNDVKETFFRGLLGLVYVSGSLRTKKCRQFARFLKVEWLLT